MVHCSQGSAWRLAQIFGVKPKGAERCASGDLNEAGSHAFNPGAESFDEASPGTAALFLDQCDERQTFSAYIESLFPVACWIRHYNMQWLAGDLIAGITTGAIVVPQGMAYAALAKLAPEFGLYSSFMGVVVYWIFGTSKDISIGPVAVLSTVVGGVVQDITSHPDAKDIPAHVVASALSVVTGLVVLSVGILRCGWVVDLVSVTTLSAFTTGSAFTIAASQLPSLLGLTGFSSRDPAYRIIMNTLEHLHNTRLDALMGLTALFVLHVLRRMLTALAQRYPAHGRLLFLVNTMRTVFVILFCTLISWLVNMPRRHDPLFRIVGNVPSGFRHVATPKLPSTILLRFASHLPATVIVMLAEHIAISKSFGRVNNYSIDPSQEMVAIGFVNILGPLLGAYPTTGSFSRTAIQSKAGARTPAAGLVAGMVVLLATYCLTAVFYYIPMAALAAVVIHAVGDLVTSPNVVYQFWRISPAEVLVFFSSVSVSIFAGIENGLYTSVVLSAVVLLYHMVKACGRVPGQRRYIAVLGDNVVKQHSNDLDGQYGTFDQPLKKNANPSSSCPSLFFDDEPRHGLNMQSPCPGIFFYQLSGHLTYLNANNSLNHLATWIMTHTRRSTPEVVVRSGDRPWNNTRGKSAESRQDTTIGLRPILKAVVLDFSRVLSIDVTALQRLVDVRHQLDLYAAPGTVDWHISGMNDGRMLRALNTMGFEAPTTMNRPCPSAEGTEE